MAKSAEPTTLSLERFAPEARALIVSAQSLADERRHAEVLPLHLAAAAVSRDRRVADVFRRAGADPSELVRAADRLLSSLPRSNEPAYLSAAMLDLIERAEREATRERRNAVSAGDVLNALSQESRGPSGELFSTFGIAPGALRAHLGALTTASATAHTAPAAAGTEELLRPVTLGFDDPIVGREAELQRILTVLERRSKCHPLLVGEPGVGKHALVVALARTIEGGNASERLGRAPLRELDTGALTAGTRLRGEVEERFRRVLAELRESEPPRILVVRELDELAGTGMGSNALFDLLRGALERRELRLVATVTPEGEKRIEEREPLFLRLLTRLPIEEPTAEQALEILRGISPRLAEHHGVSIAESALRAAADLAKRYVQDRHLPDSALDLLDEAAARVRVRAPEGAPPVVEKEDVAATLAVWTGIPVQRMLEGEAERLLKIEDRLKERVVGQDAAVSAVARAARRGRVGLRDPGRPIGSFLFLGPSGVGKTELAKALAELLFDDEHALTRLDMSEFMERHMAQRLLGAPPGYADSEQGGFLTEAVRRRPYSALLFDEVEKAHQDVFNLLLQVLDEGRLTDGRGRLADFSNTVVILTTNIGSDRVLEAEPRIFEDEAGREALRDVLLDELRRFFRPELLNRIDEVLVFRPLSRDDLLRITDLELAKVERLLADREIRLDVTDAAKSLLVELGYEPALGARPIRRTILRHLQDPLAEALLTARIPNRSTVLVDRNDDTLSLTPREEKPGA